MCNAAVLQFLNDFQKVCKPDFDILEVGSQNINGTPRTLFQSLVRNYTGVDLAYGDGVDQVVNACELLTVFNPDQFDMVISTEMLEHCHDWRMAISQMKTVLKPGGYLLLTTRSPGFKKHNLPDYWRFTVDHFRRIVADFEIMILTKDTEKPGVFVAAVKPSNWVSNDLHSIQPYTI